MKEFNPKTASLATFYRKIEQFRFTKVMLPLLQFYYMDAYRKRKYFGNDKDITLDINNPNVLGIKNNSNSAVKITFKPR
ncbi:hypothetical protein [Spiroplasma endosymbiont of Seladonia tumulorum]|uniref:hypothetical protein n=1 Tax=Spiroplasma endosymbiont of Seladonia tumulorum TaxID=3066321 RepID=UPI0030CE1F67